MRHLHTAHHWEMIGSFLELFNFEPKWVPSNAWGQIDPESGEWIGAIAEIKKDQADVAIGQMLGCQAERSMIARCLPSAGKA